MIIDLPSIGAAFGGGYYGGSIAIDGKTYAMIVAPKVDGQKTLAWKDKWSATPGALSVNDGFANSQAMDNDEHPAAQFCRSLTIGGFDDWYLPASAEHAAIWANLGPNHTPIAAFQDGAPEAFDGRWYLSSTEFDSDYVWLQRFDVGTQDYGLKGIPGRCRAVRKVIL